MSAESPFAAIRIGALALSIVPLLMLAGFALSTPSDRPQQQARAAAVQPLSGSAMGALTVIIVIDSLSEEVARNAAVMPNLEALAGRGVSGPQRSCAANFTTPCLITVFEGRQSPYLASLNNFSAKASANPNYFAILRDRGLRLAVLSDHTLTQLYPGAYQTGVSYDELRIPMRERDAYAFEQTRRWVEERRHDVVVVHIVETDQAAHRHEPGHADYRRIFGRADGFVGDIASRLDLTRDNLVVFGDHGHGPQGHHTRKSWYVAAGPDLVRAEVAIDQPSLFFLLAGLHRLPLPQTYEGSLVWELFREDAAGMPQWRQVIANGWDLVPVAATRESLEGELASRLERLGRRPLANLISYLPWWLHAILAGAALIEGCRRAARLPAGFGWFQFGWLGAAVATGWGWLAWAALLPQLWFARPGLRMVPLLLAWSAVAAASGLLMPWIVDWFHVRSGFSMVTVVWLAAFVGLPLVVGWQLKPFGAASRHAQAILMVIACAAGLAMPGVHYYGSAQMVHVLFFPLALSVLAWEVVRCGLGRWPMLAAFLVGLPFMYMSTGGLNWTYVFHARLGDMGAAVSLAVGLAALGACWLMWRRAGPVASLLVVALLLANGMAQVALFGFEPARVAGFALLLVCLTAGLRLLADGLQGEDTATAQAWQVAMLAGLAFVALWSATDGFFLKNLRFEFALKPVEDLVATEARLAGVVAAAVALKYGLVVAPVVAAAALALGVRRLVEIAPWVVLAATGKVMLQSVQLVSVEFVEVVKSSELLIQEMAGFSFMAAALWLCLMTVALAALLGARRGWRPSPAPARGRRHGVDISRHAGGG